MRLAASAVVVFLASCGHGAPPRDPVGNTLDASAPPTEDVMTITSSDQVSGHDDQIVHVVGTYLVQNLGRYRITSVLADGTELQSNKLSYLQLTDGGSVRLGARPDDELAALTEQRVIATGRLKESWPPPDPSGKAAQPNPKPTLLEITEIRPAPGS